MTDVCLRVPVLDVELEPDDARNLLEELDLLDRPAAARARARLVDAGQSDGRIDLEEWTAPELRALCRALDHLRDLRPPDGTVPPGPSALWRLRDAVVAFAGLAPVVYELALAVPDGRERTLRSASGPYAPGDRCAHGGEAYTVLAVVPGSSHERLVCDPF